MTGTFKTKTRFYTSEKFLTPISGRKSFIESAVDFRRSLIENSAMSVLNADIAVKAAMSAGLSTPSVEQSAGDGDGKKRVNKGGVPGMDETEDGYRYIPDATWGPGKTLKLFPSRDNRQSSNKVPNFGFVDQEPIVTPEQYVQQMEKKPKIRMSKYKVNSRTGEPIDDTEVEFDRMRFGKTFDINPDASDEVEELASEEIQEKSLGRTLKQRMPGGSLVGRAAARFGVIMDELGKMRCPPGTPAANQFTDMTGSNCFGTSPGTLISEAINLAQRLVPDDDPRRSSGTTRRIVNMMFDLDNGIFGNNVWYHADGTRMKHGEWRKFREAGGVAKNERWMLNGVDRTLSELDSQDARMEDLYRRLGVDTDDARKATNEDVFDAFQKLRDSGVIRARLDGRPTPAQVEAMMTSRLKNMDAHWIARTDAEKKALLDIEVKRYRELERAHIEAFLDEVIKNPEHMKTIGRVTFNPTGKDRASFGIDRIGPDGKPVGSINIDIPSSMEFQDSMLPNLSPDERLRIWAEGGTSDTLRAMAVKDFLVNSNSHAGEMMAMVDGGRGLGRHDMKHEIAHSIQAVAIFNHMKRELDARGSLIINRGNDRPPLTITDVSQLDSDMLMALMSRENFAGIDLDALKNLRSRADVVAFLGGRYIDQFPPGKSQRAMEIGAELWALRSAGLIYGDDVDAALEYMDDVASGKITIDRTVSDSMLTRRVYEEHLDGSRRIREAREARERDREYAEAALAESDRLAEEAAGSTDDGFFDADERAAAARVSAAREAYAAEKRAEVKSTKEKAKTMTEDEMVDFLTDSTEASDMLSEMLDALEESGEEADWMAVMDRDALDLMSKAVIDAWVKRFTVRRSPEAMEKLQKMVDDKRESRGTLSSEKIKERQFRNFKEDAEERAKDMELDDLVQSYSDWDELASEEGLDGVDRAFRKELRDMYREEYIKRRTEGPDSISREDARKEFNSKFKTMRKPKTTAAREREKRANPKKFKTHNGKDGARTFATQERERLLEGATTAEKVAFVEMGSGDTDVMNMMSGTEEGMAAARAIQRRNTRLRKNGVLPDELNHHEASIEQQVENFYIPLVELMDKSSLSQTVEMHIDSNDDAASYVTDLLNGNPPEFTVGIGTGTLVTDKTDFSDGKKIIIRVPEGSRALFPDWSFYSDSDNGEQKMMIPPSKFHLVEVRDDGTVVLEVGEQRGTEEILRDAVDEIGPGAGGAGDVAYRQGLQKKVDRVVEKRIAERRAQGIFDPEKRSPVEEERFSASADNATAAAGFTPDAPPRPTTPPPTRPAPKRGVDRKRSTAAIDRAKDSLSAQQELDAINAFITGEGAYQGRTNFIGTKVGSIMESNFGTRNISELTEEQKYDLIDLISEAMSKAPSDQQRGLSQARSRIQDHVDISKMMSDNNYSDPYAGGSGFGMTDYLDPNYIPPDNRRMSSGAKWGQMPSSNEQISRLLNSANNDGFNEIYGPPQTREERIAQMAEMQSEVLSSLREIADNIPGSGNELGLSASNIDPVILDLVKNSSDEELYEIISKAAMDLHQSFDARPRVRMREDELEKFIETQRYGRESSFDSGPTTFSSGLVRRGIKARAKERAVEMIAERIGKDEDSREIAEMVLNTASALKYGPEAALTRLAIDLGRRGSRDIAERTVQELVERGKITDEQAKSIMSKIDKVAPEGLPDPLKRGVGRAARAAADALDTPENRERLDNARQAAGEAADRAREAVGEGARNLAERGRERLRRLRERDDRGELPSSPEDVPFGDFDPADSTFSSGRRLDRRVSNSEVGRERIMDGAKKTRTRFSSGATPEKKEPKKPSRPREPDNGPMTGKFIEIFRGVKSYQEMLDRYNEQEVIFFDYETTGFDPKVERPVQIGAVKMKGGKVVARFNVFSNPEKELSDWSKENLVDADGNPLTNEWLSGQPSISEAHQQLVDFFGPDALLGGQYTPFDLGFLEESLKSAGIEWKPAGVIDSKALADELLPKWTPESGDGPFALNDDGTKFATNSLGPLSEYLGVDLKAWHTADADSEASAMIVQKILERAAVREDTPKHLINVENLPAVVAERRAKHKLAMDKYFADMKQYNADMEEFKASQDRGRFSSGRTDLMGGRENPRSISVDKRYGDTSGSRDFSQEQLKTIDAINERLSNSGINFEWISLENEDGTATSSPLVNFADRPIVAVRIDEDTVVPFYRSTGLSGKDQDLYPAGKWYPFWGYSSGSNLFIKDEGMQDYYGVPELEDISKQLDILTEGLPKLRNAEWRNVENLEERKPHPVYGTTSGSMNEDFLTLINNTSKRSPELNPNSISWSKKRAGQIISSERRKKEKSTQRFSSGGRISSNQSIYTREGGRPSDKLETSSLLRKSSDGKESSAVEVNGKTYDIKMKETGDGVSFFVEDENGKQIAEIALDSNPSSYYSSIVSVSAQKDAQEQGALEAILDSLLINNPETTFRDSKNTKAWFKYVTNDMADYGLKGNRQVGFFGKFSDGERANPDGDYVFASSLRVKPKKVSSKSIVSGSGFTEVEYSWNGDVYDIAGESVSFGVPEEVEFDDASIKKIPLNPFKILELDPTSQEGREASLNWMSAIHGAGTLVLQDGEKFNASTYVSALMYAASKGDSKAKEEFEALIERSNNILKKLKEKEPPVSNPEKALPLNSRLVHQTSYKPTIDKDGYLVLRPLEDFPQRAPDGSEITVNRTTLHTAINHLAEGHMFRTETQGKSYVVIMPLDSFVEQNPDSLENLHVVDTAITPPPGDGLRLAPGTFKIIEINETDNGRKMVEDALREDGVNVLQGGERGSGTPGADEAAMIRAQMLGIPTSVASDLDITIYETLNRSNINQNMQYSDVPASTEIMQTASKNTLMRMANRTENSWTAFEKKTETSFSSGKKETRTSKEILDEAAGLGINWQGKTIGTSQEDVDRRVTSSIKMLRRSKELGLTDVPELSDDIKKIFNDYADGKISLKGMREAILFTDPKDDGLRQWAFGKQQLPIGWRVAAAREIALSQNDTELVKRIDDFIAFMGDIDNVSDEKLEELIRKASVDFGKNMGSPIIQTPDVKRIIRGAGGVTVHDTEERRLDNLSGTTWMGDSITISARRKAETMYGLPFAGENTPEDRALTAMRPISGHSLPKDSHLAREKRMKKIYGEDFVTMYDFPIGSDVADLSQTAKYGRSHIVLSDAVNERTKVVNGDAVARFGSDGAAVAEIESVGESGIAYADPAGMLFSSMTGDSGASIAGPLDPSFAYAGKYNETATLGTFDPGEVRAVYIADIGQTRREIGEVPQAINPDYYGNLSVIFDFARTRDEILDSRGTELVAQIGEPRGTNGQMGVLEYLHPENVELFNSSMTSAWLDRYDEVFGDIPREVLIPKDEPGTTPYEAYLRAKITQFDKSGKGTLKENAATFGEKRDGREFGLEVLEEELDRAVTARKNRTASGERFSSGATGRSSAKPASTDGPRANKPKRVKKYKGYELKEPDNPEPKPGEFPDDVVEAAKKHRAEIEKVEAEITKLLIDLAEKNNARMEGLDFRLKALKSLMRKIAAEKDSEHGGDAQKAAEAMSDVVRYTMSYGEEDYVAGVKDVVEQMQKLGYDLRIKNYWQSDDPYQGINVAVTHPDGTKFELQFHTPQSVAEKEKIHLMYEDYRGSTDPKQRWELYQKMVEIANKIGVPIPPEELLSIGEIKVQPFS